MHARTRAQPQVGARPLGRGRAPQRPGERSCRGFRILDCLDFDDRLRYVDRLDDVAFLAMDFEFLGHGALGDRLVADYQRMSGDTAPTSLCDHYISYRATVRAKVDSIRAGQGDPAAGERLRAATTATDASADLVRLHCVCPAELAHRRLDNRHGHESDATTAIADAMAVTAAPWPDATTVDTSGPFADAVATALHAWHTCTPPVPAATSS